MRFRPMTWLAASLAALLAAGCAGSDTASTDEMGTARIGLITPQVLPFELTRVSVETNTGFSVDLARDPFTGVFEGTLLLPVGVHELIGRAFVDADQVGVSSPVPADIQAGVVTQVTIQILDTTGGPQPDFGPLIESLSHPTSSTAGAEVMFAVSIIDPDGTPVSIDWSDDCADSTFTAAQSTATGWSKATPGTCNVTVTGASNGASVSQSFSIVVFPPGANQGAVDIVNEFIAAPTPELQFYVPEGFCTVGTFSSNASCAFPAASPTVPTLQVVTNWQNGSPGAVTLSDDCGGTLGVTFQDPSFVVASWLPPVQGGICRLTAHAVNQQGVVGELSMAVLVRPGTPRQPNGAPSVSANLFGPGGPGCFGSSDQG
ncbi:MAG TPA: hypothetical protein VNM90_30205, partial [Haliangium sp.]|nr:hypothetical protein [Haliangium sp.]